MIVVGGQAPKAIRSVECYDFQEDRWYQVADLPSRRCRAGQFVFSLCCVGLYVTCQIWLCSLVRQVYCFPPVMQNSYLV